VWIGGDSCNTVLAEIQGVRMIYTKYIPIIYTEYYKHMITNYQVYTYIIYGI
jgi:hypothetical protein